MIKSIGIVISNITKRAGTERAVVNLSNILSANGYSISIISIMSKSGFSSYNLNENVKIHHLDIDLSAKNKINKYIKLINEVDKICCLEKLDMLIGTYSVINFLLVFIKNKIKKVGCEHFNYGSTNFIIKNLRKFFYTKLDAVVVLTDRDSEKYTFIDRKKLFVIPNSMSFITNDICDINSKKILSVGRLSKQKGFDLLIDALAKIDIKDDWEVNIVGEGEDKNKLINQIREKKLQKQVNILDTTDDIRSLFAASSFYVMSSRWEGLPMVLIEAKTYGLPIVSFDCPEGPSFVVRNGIDGYLVQPENTDELAKKIEMLMKDESLRERMCFESKKDSSRFHPEQIYLLWKDLLNKIDF